MLQYYHNWEHDTIHPNVEIMLIIHIVDVIHLSKYGYNDIIPIVVGVGGGGEGGGGDVGSGGPTEGVVGVGCGGRGERVAVVGAG